MSSSLSRLITAGDSGAETLSGAGVLGVEIGAEEGETDDISLNQVR